jgi:hypothetical protein
MSHLRITDVLSLQSSIWTLIAGLDFNWRYQHLHLRAKI